MGLVELNGILGLDFGLTGWPFIPNYHGDNNSIEKLCSKIIRHGCAASAQACRLGLWRVSENSRGNCEMCFRDMIEKCYATVMTTMSFVRNATWAQLSIPIPESSQWVKDEVEVHRLKRKFLKEELVILRGIQFRIEGRTPKQLGGQNDQIPPELALDAFASGGGGPPDSDAGARKTLGAVNGDGGRF